MIYDSKDSFLYVNVWEWLTPDDVLNFINLHKVDNLVFDSTSEPFLFDPNNRLDELFFDGLNNLNLRKCNIFTGHFIDNETINKFPNLKFSTFPFIFLSKTAACSHTGFNFPLLTFDKENIKTLFHSHIGRPREHRCMLIDYLSKEGLFDYSTMSYVINISEYIGSNNKEHIDGYFKYKYWTETKLIDSSDKGVETAFIDNYAKPGEQYINSLFDLVQETSPDHIFWTEKTWKPVLYEKPFIIWGAPKINSRLKEFGFKLFDSVVDYSFDEIEDTEERAKALVSELKRLSSGNYQQMYSDMRDVCETNRKQAIEIIYNEKSERPIFSQISKLTSRFSQLIFNFDELNICQHQIQL